MFIHTKHITNIKETVLNHMTGYWGNVRNYYLMNTYLLIWEAPFKSWNSWSGRCNEFSPADEEKMKSTMTNLPICDKSFSEEWEQNSNFLKLRMFIDKKSMILRNHLLLNITLQYFLIKWKLLNNYIVLFYLTLKGIPISSY